MIPTIDALADHFLIHVRSAINPERGRSKFSHIMISHFPFTLSTTTTPRPHDAKDTRSSSCCHYPQAPCARRTPF